MFKRIYESKYKQLAGLILLLVLCVMAMVLVAKCSHSRESLNAPFSNAFLPGSGDTINVAIEMNPSIYMVKGDSIYGTDYEMLQAISKYSGRPMKFHPFVPLDYAMEQLNNGTFDLLVASLPLTTDLKEKYLMTDPVYLDREILVQSADAPISSQIDLGGDTVWITSGSPFISRLANMSDEIGDTIYAKSSPDYSAEALFILTAKGVIKHAVINENIAKELSPKYPDVNISTPISFTQFQSWALRKDSQELCDSINSWLRAVGENY